MLLGGIEAGGTKMVCALVDERGNVVDREVIKTTTPDKTIHSMVEYFAGKGIAALGIGCFGPINLNEHSDTYGCITSTPKPGWSDVDMLTPFRLLNVPIGFDTDVNAAVLGEARFGAAKDADSALYITIGTGIGVGVFADGKLYHGHVHPEGGHIFVNPHPLDLQREFKGNCPFHDYCLEGMASGPAIEKRWGRPATQLYDCDVVWDMEAYYIGAAIANYTMLYSPEKIVLWGGVMHKDGLLDMVKTYANKLMGGYVSLPQILLPKLGENPGVIGASQLGYDKLFAHHF